jgi:3-deoxy-D-manno-oct-2-ulosonic acid (Kdo) hydroxylase
MVMSDIFTVHHASWTPSPSPEDTRNAVAALERGDVLFVPRLSFAIEASEARLLSPGVLASSKNASFDPSSRRVGGTRLVGEELERLRRMMIRFSDAASVLVDQLLPRYRRQVVRARSSFRPAEIAGRVTSWRKDDTRLHVDSFPASPVQGRRILRVFTNVNPAGRPRSWRVGGDFEEIALRFADSISSPWPVTAMVLRAMRITKSTRSPYDALMLKLHDRMKSDADYQASSPQTAFDFPSGTTWMAFTDQVSHAAMAGQYQLEQTFLLPVDGMVDENRSPLRILERLKRRKLV